MEAEAVSLFYAQPFAAAFSDAPWTFPEVALLGLLPGAVLQRHPALKLAGAWVGFALAILFHAQAVVWLLGPDALGFPFIASGDQADAAVRGLCLAILPPMLAYLAVWALLEKRDPGLIDREDAHLRAVWAWMRGEQRPVLSRKDVTL